jgi:tetratricopeptide (TPR) repeat protein
MPWSDNDCHPEQAFLAQRRACPELAEEIRASRATCRAASNKQRRDTITAHLARFLIALLLLLSPFPLAAETPEVLLTAGRVDQAMQTLEQQISTAPTAEAYNLLCRAHFELDNWDAGIPSCEKAVSLAPDNGLYHLWLGRIYGEKADRVSFLTAAGMAKKVRSEFERAVEFSPDNWEARTDLAEFYLEAPGIVGGSKDKARAQAELIAPLNPGIAHWVKARIAERSKDNVVAEQEYRAAIAASQGGARAWLNLAGFYRRTGRLDEMEQALRTMESSPLDHPAAFVDGASMLSRTGRDSPLAIRLLRRYVTSPNPVEEAPAFKAHYLLGELLEKQGDRPGAAEQYRTALVMAHTFRRAQEGLQRVAR